MSHWILTLPTVPPRRMQLAVQPVGDVHGERWIARGWDDITERHYSGSGPTAQLAVSELVVDFAHFAKHGTPRIAVSRDPRAPAELIGVVIDEIYDLILIASKDRRDAVARVLRAAASLTDDEVHEFAAALERRGEEF
jgi:hypothetical protein